MSKFIKPEEVSIFRLLTVFIIAMNAIVPAQQIKFKHLTSNDGLSQNFISSIMQDSKGFMWFGTKDGLNRYDGYSFVVYNNNPFDSTTVSGNFITALYEDSRGYIWIGTLNGGLNCFDRRTELFHRISHRSTDNNSNGTEEIKSIAEDKQGNIWIATRGEGVFKISLKNNNISKINIKQYIHKDEEPGSLSSNIVSCLMFDAKGILWVGTLNGLDRFDSDNESFTNYKFRIRNPKAPESPFDINVYSVFESKDKTFWLGTLSGLVKFDRRSGSYKLFPHHYEIFRYGWGNIIDIVEDQNGLLWLATTGELMRFNPSTSNYDYFKNDPFDQQSLSYNGISSLCIDKTGILWVGTSGLGISKYDPKANQFSTFVKKNDPSSRITGFSISSILQDDEENLWMSSDVLYKWNRKTGELKSFETSSNTPDDFGNTGAWSIIKSSDGKIWIATAQGLYCYTPFSELIKHYKYSPDDSLSLPQKETYTVFEDNNKNIWVATENYFCQLVDREKGIFQNYRYQVLLPYSQRVRTVIYQDKNGIFWIGTRNGLLRFDLDKQSFTAYKNNPKDQTSLNNDYIKSICPDPFFPDKILWIGTSGGGLNRFDVNSGVFTYFTEREGLPNNVVYGILSDKNGNLWLSTNKGLSRFNPRNNSFRNYDVNDGLQSNEFNTGAYFKSTTGEMFFGGINGLNYFYPEGIKDNHYLPEIVITNFRLGDQLITNKTENSVLTNSISETKQIILTHDEDIITFEFAALDFSAPVKNKYAYKLENFSKDWIYSGPSRSATFTHLPPGEYIFRVKGSNNDGVWNQVGAYIKIIVTPPWWSRWWAYLLYALVFICGLYLIRRYELNRLKLKNQLKLEKVETDSLRKIDKVKSNFFANISHEFRTPLTLILGQIENVMSSDISTKEKGKLQVANRNARRLMTLINQLLDLSKLESGSMNIKSEKRNIVTFVKSLFYSFESLAEKKNITLKFTSANNNIQALFDPDKMEKVIYNLVSNAFKFTPENGKIEIDIYSRDAKEVIIKIIDTGIGISQERLPLIFDRFYQVDSSSTRENEGTGIGLALTKELVQLHNGKITVNSKVNEGSEFLITLPFIETADEADPSDNYPDHNLPTDNIFLETEKVQSNIISDNNNDEIVNSEIILIVEDNSDVRSYIKEQLENDYSIIEACNGEEGILEAQKVIPDLIITDIMMPKMDGYKFSRLIRNDEKTSHIPIIMLTAKAGLDDKIEGLEKGIDAYLTKPFSAKELVATVVNLITQRKQLRKKFSSATIIKPNEVAATSVDQIFLIKIIKLVESHIEDSQFSVDKLADEMNMSVSQLNRKLNALINQAPGQLIRSLRLQRAADLLKQNAGSVAEICYKIGFNDQAYFSRAFKKQFGISPSEYKKDQKTDS